MSPATEALSPVLQLQGMRFGWRVGGDDLLVIDDWRIEAGERVLLRGDSGCGKSTLLSLAAGVLTAREGVVAMQGLDWKRLRPGQRDQRRADRIGYLFQQFNLLPYLSVLENVLLPCRFSAARDQRIGTSRAEVAGRLLDALELAPALWQRQAAELSVGQQQRVAAARALIGRPALVIADEPTSALDESRRDAFMRLLSRECESAGSALLFVTHDGRLERHFSRVVDLPELNRAAPAQRASA